MKIISFKKGMTIVEVLVAIAIMSLGMAAFTMLSVKAWKYRGSAMEQAMATTSASRMVTQLVHEIRTARQAEDGSYPIKETKPKSLTIYRDEDEDGKTERVHYFIEGDKLKKGVTKFTAGSYATEDEEVKTLLSYVTNEDKSEPLFYYYDNGFPLNTIYPMATAQPYDTRLVKVHLWVNIKPIVAPENINFEGVAEIRNLNEY